jgi:hypothetical protein
MMELRFVLASLVAATLVLGGCIGAPVVPPVGMVYSDFDAPLGAGPRDSGSKTGMSSVTAILGIISTGDGSVDAAARDGGISTVKGVDYHFTNVLGVYQRYTTVVHGD